MKGSLQLRTISLKIDLSGSVGNEARERLKQFDEIVGSDFGHQYGSSGPCRHPADQPHPPGEWRGASIKVERFLAEFALPHYLDQPQVLDAEIMSD